MGIQRETPALWNLRSREETDTTPPLSTTNEGNDSIDMTSKAQTEKEKIDTLNFIKIENFVLQRTQSRKRKTRERDKVGMVNGYKDTLR